jgi:hypothetical protein
MAPFQQEGIVDDLSMIVYEDESVRDTLTKIDAHAVQRAVAGAAEHRLVLLVARNIQHAELLERLLKKSVSADNLLVIHSEDERSVRVREAC